MYFISLIVYPQYDITFDTTTYYCRPFNKYLSTDDRSPQTSRLYLKGQKGYAHETLNRWSHCYFTLRCHF